MDYYTQKIIEMSFTPLLSFSRKRESRCCPHESRKLKSWIPCQARNDRQEHIFTYKHGFTLIELVITMVLIGIVALIVANAMSTGIKAFFATDNRKEALDQSRIAMERMTREIRNVRSSADVPTGTNNQFCFTDISGTKISFRYDGSNNLLRGEGGAGCPGTTENTLSTNINTFSFSYIRSDGTSDAAFSAVNTKRIRIVFSAIVSGESITLQSEVWPRSL